MNRSYEQELEVAKTIARQAGVIIRKYFFENDQGVKRKTDGSAVTVADLEINRRVIEQLSSRFDDGIIGEEQSTAAYGMGRCWLCDPIDGTRGFIWGTPTAMFSLGLVVDGIPVLGVAYDAFLDLLYYGVKGQGSYCNDKRLTVSEEGLSGSYVAVTSSIQKLIDYPETARELLTQGARLATFSGAVYKACLVARGKLVGYMESGIGAHDLAAVQVIVEEAGGKVTGFDGNSLDYSKPFRSGVVSNKKVHDELLTIIAATRRESS